MYLCECVCQEKALAMAQILIPCPSRPCLFKSIGTPPPGAIVITHLIIHSLRLIVELNYSHNQKLMLISINCTSI